MVGTSRKDSTKDEVRTSTLGYVQALRRTGQERHQGSAMSAWGAPSPRSQPAGVEVSLDKADAVIDGGRKSIALVIERLASLHQAGRLKKESWSPWGIE